LISSLTTAIWTLPINALDSFIINPRLVLADRGEQKQGPQPEEPEERRGAVPFLSAALRPRLAKSERLSVDLGARAGMGHEDQFPRPTLSARCRFSQRTFAGAHRNDKVAPIAAVRRTSGTKGGPLMAVIADATLIA
jgi:hypothetical protein